MPKVLSIRDIEADQLASSTPAATNLVKIENGKITPETISVGLSRTVVFQNLDKSPVTIASDPHPAHSDLPDLYSPPIYKDETYTYTFTKAGTWGYHLEENPSVSGKVVVK